MESCKDKDINNYNVFKSVVSGGVLICLFCTPSDVVRNYWYFNPSLKDKRATLSTLDVAKILFQRRGIGCFWTGLHWTIAAVVPNQLVFLSIYHNAKQHTASPVASITARLIALSLMQPLEYIRTYSQANLETTRASFFKKAKEAGGLKSLYRGLVPTLIRDVPFSALHWPVNDYIYHRYTLFTGNRELTSRERVFVPLACGALSSTLATICTQPFDIVKTRIQGRKLGNGDQPSVASFTELGNFFKNYGVRGFLIGLCPRLFKIVPGCAIMSAAYRFYN